MMVIKASTVFSFLSSEVPCNLHRTGFHFVTCIIIVLNCRAGNPRALAVVDTSDTVTQPQPQITDKKLPLTTVDDNVETNPDTNEMECFPRHKFKPCGNNCRRKCSEFCSEHRQLIRKAYWLLPTGEQTKWLDTKIKKSRIVGKKLVIKCHQGRMGFQEYFLPHILGTGDINVCKSFFLETLNLQLDSEPDVIPFPNGSNSGADALLPVNKMEDEENYLDLPENPNAVGRRRRKLKRMVVCRQCGVKFLYVASLTSHMKTHAMKQFKCDICDKMLATKQSLQSHLETHTEGKRFTCWQCGKHFVQKQGLLRHLYSQHSNTGETDSSGASFMTTDSSSQHVTGQR